MSPGPPGFEGGRSSRVVIDTAAGPIELHVAEAGDGPPLLLLHGWPQHHWAWRHMVKRLAGEHRLICPDLRGFGWSDAPGTGYDPDTFAADALALLDALDLDRVGLIGHDWGGFTGFLLGLRAPERFEALLAVATPSPWPPRTPKVALQLPRSLYALPLAAPVLGERIVRAGAFLGRLGKVGPPTPDVYARRLSRPEQARATTLLYRGYLARAAAGLYGSSEEGRLTVRTRVILGGSDPAVAPVLLRGVERRGDEIRVEVVPKAGHFLPETHPDLVADRARTLFSAGVAA